MPLNLCSKDNDTKLNFNPITIDLSVLNIQKEGVSFQVKGYNFKSARAESVENISSIYNNETILFDGIALWYPDQNSNPSYIELNLEHTIGVSKITVKVYNNGTTTPITLYNNETIVEEIQAPYHVTDVIFNVKNKTIDKLRIASFEGAAISIKLE